MYKILTGKYIETAHSLVGVCSSVTRGHSLRLQKIGQNMIYRKTSDRSPRLLSVQVSQTPGLYAGPGVYPRPGLYQNMSSLLFFQKKIVNFRVYRVPEFCLFSH